MNKDFLKKKLEEFIYQHQLNEKNKEKDKIKEIEVVKDETKVLEQVILDEDNNSINIAERTCKYIRSRLQCFKA